MPLHGEIVSDPAKILRVTPAPPGPTGSPAQGGVRPCAASGPRSAAECVACDIRHLTICAALETEELRSLEKIVVGVDLEPGETLFQEGDRATAVYNISRGTIRLYKLLPDGRRQVTGFVMPGDFLGLAFRAGYAYGAEAVDHVALCRFPMPDLQRLFRQFPEMEKRLLSVAGDELAAAQEQMLLLGRKTPTEKLASFLLTMSQRAERAGQPGNPLYLPMSRADIADYLGLTVETVSRTFSRLKADGVIVLPEPARVMLVRMDRLNDMATGG